MGRDPIELISALYEGDHLSVYGLYPGMPARRILDEAERLFVFGTGLSIKYVNRDGSGYHIRIRDRAEEDRGTDIAEASLLQNGDQSVFCIRHLNGEENTERVRSGYCSALIVAAKRLEI